MKTKNIQKLFLLALSVMLFASCKKESENIFTMFKDVTVTFNNSDPRCVTDYKVVNDKDEVWIDFTINSAVEDMYSYVIETSAGTTTPSRITTAIADPAQRRSFSFIYKIPNSLYPALRDGKQSFRVYALNQKGIYIGDGYKKVTIDVNPSFKIFANRDIFLPDSTAKVLPSFFSLNDATSFSYTNGATNAAKIDFGIYRTMYKDAQGVTQYAINLYNTTAPASVFPIYDTSTWQKRATKFSAPITSQGTVFLTGAISGSTIETLAKARTINLNNTVGTTAANGLAASSAVFFLTPEGKYGMMLINQVTTDLQKRPYINVSIKMQN
ncbi:hypothetical protein [Pedobacter aquatilis]|uniref:hypothetical protein n=1 Tax=Pedobacter aquatilis TaxID=351343 RepID=UPI00292FA73F|nr:hypothetical protein [Pedobacter aquatilis]